MDKKLARENIKLAKHVSNDLKHNRYSHALKVDKQIKRNINSISKEITSGKAKKERF